MSSAISSGRSRGVGCVHARIRTGPSDREVAEETGLAVDVVALLACERHGADLGDIGYDGLTLAYLCRPVPGASPVVASVEIRAVRWVDADSVGDQLTSFESAAVLAAVTRGNRAG